MNKQLIFYREWLPLDKNKFRILAMLADKGQFCGNLSDLCRYFSLNSQTHTRNQLRESIRELTEQGFIESRLQGRTYTLQAVPKEEKLEILRPWFERLKAHDYHSESVAWEQVLKVYLWISANTAPVVTNDKIAAALRISVSTIGCAKNVLQREYEAITRRKVSEKVGEDFFQTIGQELTATAWWSNG